MIPVDQTKFGLPDGDCFAACVASLLEMPLSEIPNFNKPTEDAWWFRFGEWMRVRGWHPVMLDNGGAGPGIAGPCFSLVGGDSPRGVLHQTIWKDGRMVHDPHPSRDGLNNVSDVILLVPLDPAAFVYMGES